MGWISNLLASRDLSRLEELAVSAPAPSVFLRLGELYTEAGESDKAREIYARGFKLFPHDKQLEVRNDDVLRAANAEEKKRLRVQMDRFPNPSIFARLGELHLKDDEFDACAKICRLSLKQFPRYGGTYLLMARMAIRQNRRDEAYDYLVKAHELDPVNYGALMLLVEEQLRRGDRAAVETSLKQILAFAPGDEKAASMLEKLDDLLAEYAQKAEEAKDSMAETKEVNTRQLAQQAKAARVAKAEADAEEGDGYNVAVAHLAAVEGIEGVVLIDTQGLAVASKLDEGCDEELTAALVTNIFRTSSECEGAFGIGPFDEGILESEGGSIFVLNVSGMMVAVMAKANVKPGLLQRSLRHFAERIDALN